MKPLLQLCFSAGLMLGPAVGGMLHQMAGFWLPFTAFAAAAFMDSVLLVLCMTSADKNDGEEEVGLLSSLRFLTNCRILFNVSITFVTFIFVGYVDVSLAAHLEKVRTLICLMIIKYLISP